MLFFLLALTACAPAPSAEPVVSEPSTPEHASPAGRIGGEPILPDPVVVGGIDTQQVSDVIGTHIEAINDCFEAERTTKPELAGKVLVKFTISKDGSVANASTKSTSLRHEPTETCLTSLLAQATFPALSGGRLAVVHYPFVFPQT